MNIKHIFFDLDHTLWDFEKNSSQTFEFIFSTNDVNVDLNDFKRKYYPINNKYWKLYREDKVTKAVLRYSRLKETFDEMGYSISTELIHQLSERYIKNLSNYNSLIDGTLEILNYLNSKYNMHIITNGFEEVQYDKLKNASILNFFDHIITSERVGVKKPNPKIFRYAIALAKSNPDECIMIGDNYEADILGAKNIGMHTIYCQFNEQSLLNGGLAISKLSQIQNLL